MSEELQNPIEKMDTPYTQIHDRSVSWRGTDTSVVLDGCDKHSASVTQKG